MQSVCAVLLGSPTLFVWERERSAYRPPLCSLSHAQKANSVNERQ